MGFRGVGKVNFELVEIVDRLRNKTGNGADVGVGVRVRFVATPPLFETFEDGVWEGASDVGVARH